MAITRKKNLGLLLIEAGIIEPEQLEQALLKQAKEVNSGYIGEVLISAGLIDEKTRNRFLSQQLHIPAVDLGHFEVDKSVLGMIPERIVREYNVLPIFNLNNTINVAIKVCMSKVMIGPSIQWGRMLRILGSNRFAIRILYKTKAKLLPTKVVDKKRARCF